MATAEMNIAIRDSDFQAEITGAKESGADILASTVSAREALAARWNAIIDHPLIEWGQNPCDFEVEGLVAPSRTAIAKACELVAYMRDRGWPLPTGVIPDGEGGVVFENKQDPIYQRIEIDECGHMNLVTFCDCKLLWHQTIDV